jgi:hypothetical protein
MLPLHQFEQKTKPVSILDSCQYYVDIVGEQFELLISQAFVDECPVEYLPVLMPMTHFYIVGSTVYVEFIEKRYDFPKRYADIFWYTLRAGRSFSKFQRVYNALKQYGCTADCMDVFVRPAKRHENGQWKLFFSHMELLLDETSPIVHLLFIGSSSEDTCLAGRTGELLMDYLSQAGYSGSIVMYDPFEIRRQFQYRGFKVWTFNEYYKYDDLVKRNPDGHLYTHVFDDVWVPMLSSLPEDIAYTSYRVLSIPEGESRFAYKVVDGVLIFQGGLKRHKDFPGGIGGGMIFRRGNRVSVYGTSMSYGHYCEDVVYDVLGSKFELKLLPCELSHGRLSYDPNYNILKQHPCAKISVKYYDEKLPAHAQNGRPLEQAYYAGREKRLLFGVKDVVFSYRGCANGCEVCARESLFVSRFVSFSDIPVQTIIRGMITRACGRYCRSGAGAHVNGLMGLLLTAAKNSADVSAFYDIAEKKGYSASSIMRVLELCQRNKRVGVEKVSGDEQFNTVLPSSSGKVRYFNAARSRYKDVDGRIYTCSGELLPVAVSGYRLVYMKSYRRHVKYVRYRDPWLKDIVQEFSDVLGGVSPVYYNSVARLKGSMTLSTNSSADLVYVLVSMYRGGKIVYRNSRYVVYTNKVWVYNQVGDRT